MAPLRIAAVSAAPIPFSPAGRLTDELAAAVKKALNDAEAPTLLDVIELRDHAHDLAAHAVTGYTSAQLLDAVVRVVGADGLIAVSPIVNASYSGLFKMFFDVIDHDALIAMPVIIGATGDTIRHSLSLEHALRPMFAHLRSVVTPTSVYAVPDDWDTTESRRHALVDRIGLAAREFACTVNGDLITPPALFGPWE